MLRTVAGLIQSVILTPIRAVFHASESKNRPLPRAVDVPLRPARNRKKQKVSEEAIHILPCAKRKSEHEGRSILCSCTAIIDGICYEFDLVHQSGTLDSTGRMQRPCWSWIRVRGPRRDRPSSQAEATFAFVPPYNSLGGDLLRTRAVRQAIQHWQRGTDLREAGALAQRKEDEFQCLLIREGQRRKLEHN